MAWSAPFTFTTGLIVTAARMNTDVRDNMLETAPAKASAAGDVFVGTGANAIKRLARGTALQVLRVNAAGSDLEYGDIDLNQLKWGAL